VYDEHYVGLLVYLFHGPQEKRKQLSFYALKSFNMAKIFEYDKTNTN